MLDATELRRLVHYDPATGVFTWKVCLSNAAPVGSSPRRKNRDGYMSLKIRGAGYAQHRLAWLYMTGAWPSQTIDHINSDPSDNRFCNLREASHAENCQNRRRRVTNKSGIKGVSWCNTNRRWVAVISVGGRQKYLGLHQTKERAAEVYAEAARAYHGQFARIA
jgi:hypothetical protein